MKRNANTGKNSIADHGRREWPGQDFLQLALRAGRFCFRGLVLWLLVIKSLSSAQATLLFYEGFGYPNGVELGEVVTNPPWENDKSQFTVGGGNLDHPGIQASTGGRLNVTATVPSLDSVRTISGTWTAQSNGTLYVSFLLRIESTNGISASGDGTSILTIGKASNGSYLLGVNLLDNEGTKLGVLKYPSSSLQVSSAYFSSGPGTNLSANGSATCLIVAKYEWVNGATNDVVTVWLNPEGLGATEDPANQVSTSSGPDGDQTAGRLTLSRGPHVSIDEIRVGQTWADVTPTARARQLASEQPSKTQ